MRNSVFRGPLGRQNNEKGQWIHFLCKIDASGFGLKTAYNAKQINWDTYSNKVCCTWKWTAYPIPPPTPTPLSNTEC